MPTVEQVNYDMSLYLQQMESYIAQLRELPENTAQTRAKANLFEAGIIDEDGNLTAFYQSE